MQLVSSRCSSMPLFLVCVISTSCHWVPLTLSLSVSGLGFPAESLQNFQGKKGWRFRWRPWDCPWWCRAGVCCKHLRAANTRSGQHRDSNALELLKHCCEGSKWCARAVLNRNVFTSEVCKLSVSFFDDKCCWLCVSVVMYLLDFNSEMVSYSVLSASVLHATAPSGVTAAPVTGVFAAPSCPLNVEQLEVSIAMTSGRRGWPACFRFWSWWV